MIGLFRKKGFGTAVGIASVSLISAGFLGTNMYNVDASNERAVIESNQVMSLVKMMYDRLRIDNTVAKFTATTPSPTIYNTARGLTDGRLHFLKKDQKCNSHYPALGIWNSGSAPAVPSLPCNVFRVSGPFKTNSSGCNNSSTCISVIPSSGRPLGVISIPLTQSYLASSYRATLTAIRKLQSDLSSNATAKIFIYKKISGENNSSIVLNPYKANTNMGISSSTLFPKNPNGCNISSSPCTLVITLLAPQAASTGGGSGQDCANPIKFPTPTNNCLDIKGSNSMLKQVSFDKDGTGTVDFGGSGPLLVWKSDQTDRTKINNSATKAGFILSNEDLTLKLPADKHFNVDGDLNVNKAATIRDGLVVGKDATVGENLLVTKNATIRDKLYLDKAKNKSTFFEVDSNEDLNISTNTNKHVIIRGELLADKAASVRKDLSVGTDATIGKNAYINDTLYMNKEGAKDTFFQIDGNKDLNISTPKHLIVRSDLLADKAASVRTDLSVGTDITAGKNITTNEKLIFGKDTSKKTNFEVVDNDLVLNLNDNKHLNVKGDINVSGYTSTSNLSVKETALIKKLIVKAKDSAKNPAIEVKDDNKITIGGFRLNKLLPGLALQDVLPTPIGSYIWKPDCPTGSWPAIFTMPLTVPNQVHGLGPSNIPVVNLYHIYPRSIDSQRWRIYSKGGTYSHFPGSTPVIYSQIYCDNRGVLDDDTGSI